MYIYKYIHTKSMFYKLKQTNFDKTYMLYIINFLFITFFFAHCVLHITWGPTAQHIVSVLSDRLSSVPLSAMI